MRHARVPAHLPGDVDLVVAAVGPDPPRAEDPLPQPEPALLDQRPVEDQRAAADLEVRAGLLAHAVDEDGEGLPDVGWERDPRAIHRGRNVQCTVPVSAPLRSTIPYTVRRSPRARRTRVTVQADRTVEVTLPRRASERDAATAVEELRPWIERRLRALDRAADERQRPAGTVPYLGEELRLVPQAGRTRVRRRG